MGPKHCEASHVVSWPVVLGTAACDALQVSQASPPPLCGWWVVELRCLLPRRGCAGNCGLILEQAPDVMGLRHSLFFNPFSCSSDWAV